MPLIPGDKGNQISEFKASMVKRKFQVKKCLGPGMEVHTFNPTTQKAEACKSLSSSYSVQLTQ